MVKSKRLTTSSLSPNRVGIIGLGECRNEGDELVGSIKPIIIMDRFKPDV